jgi:predicted MPP superfamily phosphohydrolase
LREVLDDQDVARLNGIQSMMAVRIAIFVLVVTGLVSLTHYYIWARLVRDAALPAPWPMAGKIAISVLAVVMAAGFALSRGPRGTAALFAWVGYVWMGVVFYLLVLFFAADIGRFFVSIARSLAGGEPPDEGRRLAIARIVAGAVGVVTLGVSGVALASGLRAAAVKRVRVALGKWPRALDGYRIVQLSDIHVGPTIGRAFMEDLVRRVNALSPDLVAITGDLVDGSVEELGDLVRPLADLKAKDGVFFVTGNHEYYSGAEQWMHFLTTLGVEVLNNDRVTIRGFDLAGVPDWSAGGFSEAPDLARALAGRDPNRPCILLAHQPKQIVLADELGVDLQLSGHTHGGQLFPFRYLVGLQQPYVAGLHVHRRAQIYVSSGTGYWGPPMRLAAPAEITDIEVASA